MSPKQLPPATLPVFRGQTELASYRDPLIPHYRDNPLIEALPPIWTVDEAIELLAYDPGYDAHHQQYPPELRLHLVQNVVQFFEPLSVHLDLEQRFSRMIRAGYQARNPLAPRFWAETQERVQTLGRHGRSHPRIRSTAVGFSIVGMSGVGKTTTVEAILSLYPQVIFHSHYRERDFTWVQVVWLKLECPFDGSTKGLCLNFFQALDSLLGTHYYQNYTRQGQATTDEMLPHMARAASLHSIGVLVLDELQHLSQAKSGGPEKMLNFFVQLVNTIGMPVVLVGTYKALSLLTGEFRQARRGTGQGDLVWDRMAPDEEWDLFVEALWRYQYVRQPTPLTPLLNQTLYDVSQGITDFAVKAYLLAQIRAISRDEESLTAEMVCSVAADSFRLANPVLSALRRGDMQALHSVEDVHPIALEPYLQSALLNIQRVGCLRTGQAGSPMTPRNPEAIEPDQSPSKKPQQSRHESSTRPKRQANGPSGLALAEADLRHVGAQAQKRQVAGYQALQEAGYLRSAWEYLEGERKP